MLQGRTSLLGESGQTAVEYAGALALVAIVLAIALNALPGSLFDAFWAAVRSALT
jgi:Flp pilus assembly pilin Flp